MLSVTLCQQTKQYYTKGAGGFKGVKSVRVYFSVVDWLIDNVMRGSEVDEAYNQSTAHVMSILSGWSLWGKYFWIGISILNVLDVSE